MFTVTRSPHNPILSPDHNDSFESYATFNPNPIRHGGKTIILYRAQSEPEAFEGGHFSMSSIGKAEISQEKNGGYTVGGREQFIAPEESWERYGCEDPRVTKIDGRYFIFYTALSAYPLNTPGGIKVGLAISKDMKTISERHLVTPFNAKAMSLFPEKIGGKYVAMLTVNSDILPSHITLATFNKIEDMWDETYWKKWYEKLDDHIFIRGNDADRIEIGSGPLKTKEGWLFLSCRIKRHAAPDRVFAIEAVLLDLKNPKKVISMTNTPLLVPEESYEKYGQQPNIIFPSGALIKGDTLSVYYGATDTTCAVATVSLSGLLTSMKFVVPSPRQRLGLEQSAAFMRLSKKPILVPRVKNTWESKAVFNPAALRIGETTYILYRAMSEDNTSVIGYAESRDGIHIDYRAEDPIYIPKEDFEIKKIPGGNSGCEDPRIVQIDKQIYIYYTAYNGVNPPDAAMISISEKDFLLKGVVDKITKKITKDWNWNKAIMVTNTSDSMDDKDACVLPEKIKQKGRNSFFLFHRVNHVICGDWGSSPTFPERSCFKNIPILLPRPGMWDSQKVGLGPPPIKTKKGWLLIYHGISDDGTYRVGAALLDLKNPTQVISRTTDYIFEPEELYEIQGQVNKVVFPCGAVTEKGMVYLYYGGGDSVVNVAGAKLKNILKALGV